MAFGLCFGLGCGFKLIFGLKEDSGLVQAVLRPLTPVHAKWKDNKGDWVTKMAIHAAIVSRRRKDFGGARILAVREGAWEGAQG